MDEDLFQFKAPQFVDSWAKDDDDSSETFFNENKDPQTSSTPRNLSRRPLSFLMNKDPSTSSTPRNLSHRSHSFSVISRSGKRCPSSFKGSAHIRERESFKKRILNSIQENETQYKFKARPATVIKKEPFCPQRNSRFLATNSAPTLKTEKRAAERKLICEKKKKLQELYETERDYIKKIDDDELKQYRKTLEFKATAIKKK